MYTAPSKLSFSIPDPFLGGLPMTSSQQSNNQLPSSPDAIFTEPWNLSTLSKEMICYHQRFRWTTPSSYTFTRNSGLCTVLQKIWINYEQRKLMHCWKLSLLQTPERLANGVSVENQKLVSMQKKYFANCVISSNICDICSSLMKILNTFFAKQTAFSIHA